MFERFSQGARSVVVHAQAAARRRRDDRVGAEHVLLALCDPDSGVAASVLREHGLTAERVEQELSTGSTAPDIDADALRSIGIDLDQIVEAIERRFGEGAFARADRKRGRWPLRGSQFAGGNIRFDDAAKKVLELSLREAITRGDREIDSAHILLGLLRTDAPITTRIFDAVDVSPATVRASLEARLRRSA